MSGSRVQYDRLHSFLSEGSIGGAQSLPARLGKRSRCRCAVRVFSIAGTGSGAAVHRISIQLHIVTEEKKQRHLEAESGAALG